jgi:glycosyltransferase involved in cell wall biosynthesis
MVDTAHGVVPERMAFRNHRFLGEDHLVERAAILADNLDLQLRLGPLVGAGRGRTVVILGNGPSLNEVDPHDLTGVTTIGSNFIHLFDPESGFLPSIVTCSNLLVVEQGVDTFRALDTAVLLPSYARGVVGDDHRVLLANVNHDTGFSADVVDGASTYSTVTYVNLQLAATLGFDRIVLTGFDHNYQQPDAGSHGSVIEQDDDDVNHFSSEYFKGKSWQKADADEMAKVYVKAKINLPDTTILNATVGGHLEVFPRATLADAVPADEAPVDLGRLHGPRRHPERVVVSVNPNAQANIGHYIRFDQRLRRALNHREVGFVSLGSLELEPEVERANAWLVPTFSGPFSAHHIGDPRVRDRMPAFSDELDRGHRLVRHAAERAETSTFWYMANLEYLDLVPDEGDHFLHLFFSYGYNLDDEGVRRRVAEHLRKADDRGIRIAVPTPAEAMIWSDRLDRPVPAFASAPSMLFADHERPDAGPRSGVFFPGTGSQGKGHDDATTFADRWRRLDHPVTIRTTDGTATTGEAAAARSGEIGHHDMRRLFIESAVVALPYRPDPFARRSSGSFTEAVRAGAPIVACQGTYMGDLVERYELGATYAGGDIAALNEAIELTLAEHEAAATNVRRFRDDRFAAETSWATVAAQVLG